MMVLQQQQQQRLWDATTTSNTNTQTQQSANVESTPTKVCHQENAATHTCEFFRVAILQPAMEAFREVWLELSNANGFGLCEYDLNI